MGGGLREFGGFIMSDSVAKELLWDCRRRMEAAKCLTCRSLQQCSDG